MFNEVSGMDWFSVFDQDENEDNPAWKLLGADRPRDKPTQIVLSLALGLTAFFAFCFLRLRWTTLYSGRKGMKIEASILPELPKSLFGWIIPLFRITDQQILASAGLDAYVFLAFFKLAMKFLLVTFFFSLVVIKPVHDAIPDNGDEDGNKNSTSSFHIFEEKPHSNHTFIFPPGYYEDGYLWMYVVFGYLFSAIAVYLIITETRRIIELRQEYLGTQTSITDRTMRLSGIPAEIQDEGRIKELIEELDIGKVESVTLCRKWKELDEALTTRMDTLRRLEEAYTIHFGYKRIGRNSATLPTSQPIPPSPQPVDLLNDDLEDPSLPANANITANTMPYERARPTTTLWYGRLNLQRRKVDAIDYYEGKLKDIDEKVKELRQGTFAPTPLAFVTMDSVAACQMAIQAVLDPSPQQLIANQSPAPADIIWQNTYLTRRSRMLRSWSITALTLFSTVFWFILMVPIAVTLTTDSIGRFFPHLKEIMKGHQDDLVGSLVLMQLPTLLLSILMVLVPYFYYWLSWYQGMISQRDVELSAISKNFFFTFINFFVIFTGLGTATNFYQFYKHFGDALSNFREVASVMAKSLQKFSDFYVNFIILQGVGLFPFRLLEMGSVSLYPVYRIGAKTPRDYAELVQPPVFSYAFYLPNALLVFIVCMVYSILRSSWQILLAGLIYFAFGHFVYKYQLLYAMDHRQQANGQAWGMICDRLFVGMIFFQVSTAGQLVLNSAVARSVMMVPLIIATAWIATIYGRTYKPLLKYIALRSIKRGEQYTDNEQPPEDISLPNSTSSSYLGPEHNVWADSDTAVASSSSQRQTLRQHGRVFDESDDGNLKFINPSLVVPLEKVWIANHTAEIDQPIVDVDNNDETV